MATTFTSSSGSRGQAVGCNYGADACPKIEDCYREIAGMKEQISTITRLLYTVIGVLMVEMGFNFLP